MGHRGDGSSEGDERIESIKYEPPVIRRLGTLAELTLGGNSMSPGDGWGAAGDMGSATGSG